MSQRIAAAIAFVLLIVAAPPDAAAPRPAARVAWDVFDADELLASPEVRGLFTPHELSDELATLSSRSPLVRTTPEPGTSVLLALGLTLLARGSHASRQPR